MKLEASQPYLQLQFTQLMGFKQLRQKTQRDAERFHDLDYEGAEDARFVTPVRSSSGTIDTDGGPIERPSSPWPEDNERERTWPYEEEDMN